MDVCMMMQSVVHEAASEAGVMTPSVVAIDSFCA